jgi:hypothetical protein
MLRLNGLRVAIVASDGFEAAELEEPNLTLGRVLGQRVNCACSGFPAASSSLSRGPRRAYGPACGRS